MPGPSGHATAVPTAAGVTPGPQLRRAAHVFVIVMENRSFTEALSGSATARLARAYGLAANYRAVAHPSLPNYLALTSGSTWGIADDSYHRLPAAGIGAELTRAHVPWRAYMEGLTGDCFDSPYPYALKHDPFAYYGGRCPPQVVRLSRLPSDLSSPAPPRFAWITPGLCHDGHDCTTAVADRWLGGEVAAILASPAWRRDGGVIFITWDEDDRSAGNRVPAIVITPAARARRSSVAYDHYSLLATVADELGVGRPGLARSARAMTDLTGA